MRGKSELGLSIAGQNPSLSVYDRVVKAVVNRLTSFSGTSTLRTCYEFIQSLNKNITTLNDTPFYDESQKNIFVTVKI